MYGTLRGALAGRKIAFDREAYKATVEGRIVGVGKTHQSVKDAIHITWVAKLRAGDRTLTVQEESHAAPA